MFLDLLKIITLCPDGHIIIIISIKRRLIAIVKHSHSFLNRTAVFHHNSQLAKCANWVAMVRIITDFTE